MALSSIWEKERERKECTDLVGQHDVLVLGECLLHGVVEVGIAHTGTVNPREQVRDESQEERDVLKDKLGQVHVSQCPHQHNPLWERKYNTLLCDRTTCNA